MSRLSLPPSLLGLAHDLPLLSSFRTRDTRHKMEMVVIRNLEAAIKTGKVINLVPEQKSKLA